MARSLFDVRRGRYLVPGAAVAITAGIVAVPQLAAGQPNPVLPARTAAQLLSAVKHAHLPNFSGTVVETTRLGLPSLPDAGSAGIAAPDTGLVGEITGLLTGSHTAQIAYAGPDRQRVAIFLDDLTEADIVHNGANVWTYSSADNSVSHTVRTPDQNGRRKGVTGSDSGLPPVARAVNPQQAAQQALAAIDPSTVVSVDRTAHVAGRSAYQLVLHPRSADSLIGSVRIAIDAVTSMPLRVQVWPRTTASSPAIEVTFTSLKLATPSASTFTFTSPPGAVVKSGPFAVNPRLLGTPPGVGALIKHGSRSARAVQVPITGAAPSPAAQVPPPGASHDSGLRATGTDWLQVLAGAAPDMATAPTSGPSPLQQLTATLDRLATRVPGGRLLRTTLVSVLLTDDGRILIGAVTQDYLERLAAQGLGK